jgi:hypothetical protein
MRQYLLEIQIVSIAFVVFVLGALFMSIVADDREALNSVKSGEYSLSCLMQDGDRLIEPEMVVDYVDGLWIFKNGHASTCTLTKVK